MDASDIHHLPVPATASHSDSHRGHHSPTTATGTAAAAATADSQASHGSPQVIGTRDADADADPLRTTWTAKAEQPAASTQPPLLADSGSGFHIDRQESSGSHADSHPFADTDNHDSNDLGTHTARSSATAYSLDATLLRERVTSVGRLPKGSAASRRLAALFGDMSSSSASTSSSATPSVPPQASRDPPPQPRPRSPSPPPAPAHQSTTTTTTETETAPQPATPTTEPVSPPTSPPSAQPTPGSGLFECNICLDTASHPVVTLCGHLFCWPCLDPWFKSCASRHSAMVCPVCKSGCGPDKTIPIFARGREAVDPRTSPASSSSGAAAASAGGDAAAASPRPDAQRSEPVAPPRTWRNVWGLGAGGGGGGGGARANIQLGVFPGLFGMTINLGDGGAGGPEAMRGDPQENQSIASALTLMGVMILMNLFFGLFLF